MLHICAECERQFINPSEQTKAFPETTKQTCLKMYLNGMGFRVFGSPKQVRMSCSDE